MKLKMSCIGLRLNSFYVYNLPLLKTLHCKLKKVDEKYFWYLQPYFLMLNEIITCPYSMGVFTIVSLC